MKNKIIKIFLFAVVAAGIFYGFNYTQADDKASSDSDPVINMPDIKNWPEASQRAAKEMESKYGKPNGATADMLVWNNNGIWLKTIVYKKEMKHNFPKPHTDVVEQWINYRVPLNNYDELALYDGSLTMNRTNGTISARCDKEAMNILALNLAYDIINNTRTINQARTDYGKYAMDFTKGDKPLYTQRLNFVSDKLAPDVDQPLDVMKEKTGMGGQ